MFAEVRIVKDLGVAFAEVRILKELSPGRAAMRRDSRGKAGGAAGEGAAMARRAYHDYYYMSIGN